MLHTLRNRAQSEKGFTLIELLVVILIIGILAAIALPAFLGQRARAQDTAAKSAVREAQTAMETYYTDNQNYTAGAPELKDIEASLNADPGKSLAVTPGTATSDSYTLTVTSKTGNTFSIAKTTTGDITRTCSVTGGTSKGGCPGGTGPNAGKW